MATALLDQIRINAVVDDLSLRLADGEAIAVLSSTGSGKSRLLQAIAGLGPFERGSVYIDDKAIAGIPLEGRGIGIVFQDFALYPHLSAGDNIRAGLRARDESSDAEIAERVDEVAELVGIGAAIEQRASKLKRPDQLRTALARALIHRPHLLLLDDPLLGLTSTERYELGVTIRHAQRALKVTTIYATSEGKDAMALADRIAYISNGQLHQIDTPAIMYANPATIDVASALGHPGINLLNAHYDGRKLSAGGQTIDAPELLHRDSESEHVTIGIRPEDFAIDDARKGTLQAILDPSTWQTAGSYSIVHGQVGDAPVAIHIAGNPISVPRRAYAQPSDILCFSPNTGARLR